MQKIVIGNSDFNRKELEDNKYGWGNSSQEFLRTIIEYENQGFEIQFETNLIRLIFGTTKYKVVGYRKLIPIKVKN